MTILIVLTGIMLGLSFLNFGNKKVYKANFFQKEVIKKDHNDLIDDKIENEKSNETVIKTVSDVLLNIMKDLGIETETTILPKLSNVYNALIEIEDKITGVSELAKNSEGTIDNVKKA